jgi:hypothetical protein
MSEPLLPEQEAKAQELPARIKVRSADAILEMVRRFVATTDDALLGDTEFVLRDQAQSIVAECTRGAPLPKSGYTTSAIDTPPAPTDTAKRRSKRSADRSRADT